MYGDFFFVGRAGHLIRDLFFLDGLAGPGMWDSGLFSPNLQRGVAPGLEQGRPFSRCAAHAALRPEGKWPTAFLAVARISPQSQLARPSASQAQSLGGNFPSSRPPAYRRVFVSCFSFTFVDFFSFGWMGVRSGPLSADRGMQRIFEPLRRGRSSSQAKGTLHMVPGTAPARPTTAPLGLSCKFFARRAN